jgi:hypothetical protein
MPIARRSPIQRDPGLLRPGEHEDAVRQEERQRVLLLRLLGLEPVVVQDAGRDHRVDVGEADILRGDGSEPLPDVVPVARKV